jgi:hypothetical protein
MLTFPIGGVRDHKGIIHIMLIQEYHLCIPILTHTHTLSTISEEHKTQFNDSKYKLVKLLRIFSTEKKDTFGVCGLI